MRQTDSPIAIRILFADGDERFAQMVKSAFESLDAAVLINASADEIPPPRNINRVVCIWTDRTGNDASFFRELNNWTKNKNNKIFLCRFNNSEPFSFLLDNVSSNFHYNDSKSLRYWILKEVLEQETVNDHFPGISSVEDAIKYYCSDLAEFIRDKKILGGIDEKKISDVYLRLEIKSREKDRSVDLTNEIVSQSRKRVFVVGVPGSGKSTLVNMTALELAEMSAGGTIIFPILLRAPDVASSNYDDLSDYILVAVKGYILRGGKTVANLLMDEDNFPSDKAVLLIDGLDELETAERKKLRQQIRIFETKYPLSNIVITARPNAFDNSLWSDFNLFSIQSLTKTQVIEYVNEHGREEIGDELSRLIENSEQVSELASVPFMLALMASYAGEAAELPSFRAELIKNCVLSLLQRRRISEAEFIEMDKLVGCLTAISHRLFRIDSSKGHDESEFTFAIQSFLSSNLQGSSVPWQPSEESKILLENIVEKTGILQKNGRIIEFVHRSVWELFVALYLTDCEIEYIGRIASIQAWEEPLRLAAGLADVDRLDPFIKTLWVSDPGLALRASSECPELNPLILRNLITSSPASEMAELVRDLRRLKDEPTFSSRGERIVLDTLQVLIPETDSAEVYWESMELLLSIETRSEEAGNLISLFLDFDNYEHRLNVLKKNISFIQVEGGDFQMGSDLDSRPFNESPAHKVQLDNFNLADITICALHLPELPFRVGLPNDPRSPTKGHPIIGLTWYEAQMIAIWFGCRLPTEAEWEYACRSGGKDDEILFDEKMIPDYAWYAGNAGNSTHPPREKKANSLSIYDILGNVREWCADWYDKDFYRNMSPQSNVNPGGPKFGKEKVLRGGCFDWNTANLVPTYRNKNLPANRGFQNGVRLVEGFPLSYASFLDINENNMGIIS